MIRQAIFCDICGAERKQTNHWFVASNLEGELRVSRLNLNKRLHPGTMHLCGQTCLHKMVDEFMARAPAVREQPEAPEECEATAPAAGAVAGLTPDAALGKVESSARLPALPKPALPMRSLHKPTAELVAITNRLQAERGVPEPGESPRSVSRNWRDETGDREHGLSIIEHRIEAAAFRRSN